MGELLTTNVATNLFWFGRHLERIETVLTDLITLFDTVIDTDRNAGKAYYAQLGTTLEYENAADFLRQAMFGEHSANLYALMGYARENAIICRSQIDADAFGEVIKLHDFFAQTDKNPDDADCQFIDGALSLINEIWGALSCGMVRRKSDYFIQLGKLVEKADLNLRLDRDEETTLSYLKEIEYTTYLLAPDADIVINMIDLKANLATINTLLQQIATE